MSRSRPALRSAMVTFRTLAVCCTAATGLGLSVAEAARGAVEVSVVRSELVVRAAGADMNLVAVRPDLLRYAVFNVTSGIAAGEGCVPASSTSVTCDGPLTGGMIMGVRVEGGEERDLVGLDAVDVPVFADGGSGDDAIWGGSGPNSLAGGDGVDRLDGGRRDDRLDGGEGDDLLIGGMGSDTQLGKTGDDILKGDVGEDVLQGGGGEDLVDGGQGADLLGGGGGDDVLVGGPGKDAIEPGPGDDRILGTSGGRDTVTCGPGDQASGEVRQGCEPLQGSRSTPSAWPPEQAATSGSWVKAWALVPGRATKIVVDVRAGRSKRARVCITTRDRGNKPLDRYPATVRVRYAAKATTPRHSRPTDHAKARLGNCRRRSFR